MSMESRLSVPVTILHLIIATASIIVLAWIPIASYLITGENRITKVEEGQKYNSEKNMSQDVSLAALTTLVSATQISLAQTQVRLDGIYTSVNKIQSSVDGLNVSRFNR